MPPAIVESHMQALKSLCEAHHVRRLEAFGSVVREDFDPEHSDIDLLVDIDPAASPSYADDYFGLLEGLEQLFGRPVDLISIKALDNPHFIDGIAPERTLLFGH